MSRRLVVGTNILQSASRNADGPPTGVLCRRVLSDILAICHRAVVSPALAAEYRLHASDYGTRWLSAMAGKDKIVRTPARDSGRARRWLRSERLAGPQQQEELRKDMHLVMAALETDRLIVSAERRSRELLARVVQEGDHTPGWRVIDEKTPRWLSDGAPLTADLLVLPSPPPQHRARRKSSMPKPKAR
jgi:hypothetical protein